MNDSLTKLVGSEATKAEGQFVLNGQSLATTEGFRNVSKTWYDKTMSYANGLQKIEEGRAATEDIEATVTTMIPAVDPNGNFAFRHVPSDRYFRPTAHAVCQVGNWAGCGTWFAENMLTPVVTGTGKKAKTSQRDSQDADVLARVLTNGFRRVDPTKKFLWRTRNDGSLRAMLTDRYAVVDNRWLVEQFMKFVPNGRLSHWKGDSDTVYGNVLIPDTIREESDSDYGGMLSIGNSEIGERRVSSLPSIYRAICQNGCIWGQSKGEGIKQVHRGKIDLVKLSFEIQTNLNKQIPLLPQGIDLFLGTKILGWDGASMSIKPVFAQVAKQFKFSKPQATGLLHAYQEEVRATPDLKNTLFTVINSITRAGQKHDNKTWVDHDTLAGNLTNFRQSDFDSLINRAKTLTVDEVDEVFSA